MPDNCIVPICVVPIISAFNNPIWPVLVKMDVTSWWTDNLNAIESSIKICILNITEINTPLNQQLENILIL